MKRFAMWTFTFVAYAGALLGPLFAAIYIVTGGILLFAVGGFASGMLTVGLGLLYGLGGYMNYLLVPYLPVIRTMVIEGTKTTLDISAVRAAYNRRMDAGL